MELTGSEQFECAGRLMDLLDDAQMGPLRTSPWRGGQIIWLDDAIVMMPNNTRKPLWSQGKRAEEVQARLDELGFTTEWASRAGPASKAEPAVDSPAPEVPAAAAAPAQLAPQISTSPIGGGVTAELLGRLAASAQLASSALRSTNGRLDTATLSAWRSARIALAQLTLDVERRAE